jgi:hypothetical protein
MQMRIQTDMAIQATAKMHVLSQPVSSSTVRIVMTLMQPYIRVHPMCVTALTITALETNQTHQTHQLGTVTAMVMDWGTQTTQL